MTHLRDASTGGGLLFPGELEGTVFQIEDPNLYEFENGELQNGRDPEEIPVDGQPKHGRWLHVDTERDGEQLMNVPGRLLGGLQELEADKGDVFEVEEAYKTGEEESDEWHVGIAKLDAQ